MDLSSKMAVVTGGNISIGYETARVLAEMRAHHLHSLQAAREENSSHCCKSLKADFNYYIRKEESYAGIKIKNSPGLQDGV